MFYKWSFRANGSLLHMGTHNFQHMYAPLVDRMYSYVMYCITQQYTARSNLWQQMTDAGICLWNEIERESFRNKYHLCALHDGEHWWVESLGFSFYRILELWTQFSTQRYFNVHLKTSIKFNEKGWIDVQITLC